MMNRGRGRGRGRGGGVAVKEWVLKKVESKPTVITERSSPATAHVCMSTNFYFLSAPLLSPFFFFLLMSVCVKLTGHGL